MRTCTLIALLLASLPTSADEPLVQGATLTLNGHPATVTQLDTLPYVESEYSKRFKFDAYDNPKLADLRQRYRLDDVRWRRRARRIASRYSA